MSKKLIGLVLSFAFLLIFPSTIHAKKLLPRAAAKVSTGAAKPATSSSTRGVNVSVKFRGDRRAIVATFTNLSIAKSVSYTLTYGANGTTQGAGGSIASGTPEPAVRELLFGSCSNGICRYDRGITNAKFIVTTTLTNGKKISKSFRLKV